MKKFFKVLLYILAGIVVYCVVSFCAGLAKGYYDVCKLKKEKMTAKTFFGLTLDEKMSIPENRIVGYDDYRRNCLEKNFNVWALAREFSLRYDIVALDQKFYNADIVVALESAHDKKVRAIAVCMSWDVQNFDHRTEGFGFADETCDKIRSVLEEKYHCRMTVLDIEPTFIKKFVIRPGVVSDTLPSQDDVRDDVFISRKSCFLASTDFCATIFVIGHRRVADYGSYDHKDYLILFINTPNLNDISKREQELYTRDRELEKREKNERERKAAFDAL